MDFGQTVSTMVALITITTQLERTTMKTSHCTRYRSDRRDPGRVSIAGSMKEAGFKSAAPADQWLTIPAIHEKVATAGYTNITEIEREDNGYDVEATGPNGKRVDLRVDPVTVRYSMYAAMISVIRTGPVRTSPGSSVHPSNTWRPALLRTENGGGAPDIARQFTDSKWVLT